MNAEAIHARILALEATELLSLVGHREAVQAASSLETVYQGFRDHPQEFVGVTGVEERLVGVTSRGKIGFVLGSRFGFSLFARDPVSAYLLERQLCLSSRLKLREVLAQALSRRDEEFFHDVAVVDDEGRYLGMVSVPTLVRLQNELIVQQTRLAEEQRASLREKAALHASEERLRLALTAGRMSTWQIDPATGSVNWSTVAGQNGWTEEALPLSLAAFRESLEAEDRVEVFAALDRCQIEGQPFCIQFRQRHPGDGLLRWIESRGMPIYGPDERVTAITGLSIDITARKQAEEALRAAKEEAERANAAKSEFLSRMSHELRTPLNAILGFGQLLEMSDLSKSQQESISHVLRGGRHLLGLINEVLDIARIESGKMEFDLQSVAVAAVLEEVAALVRPLAAQKGLVLNIGRVDAALEGVAVQADRQRLKQVLLNLLSNAIKYNHPFGHVDLACEPAESTGRLRLSVRDNGPGISAQNLPRLFSPFERLDAGQRDVEGTGIGLAISKRLMEAMGGVITVSSTEGRGSTFSLELPISAEAVQREAQKFPITSAAGEAPAKPATHTVLHIEDNASNLTLVEGILALRSEIALLSTMQGRRGLEMAREHRPDLILLDVHLPDLAGDILLRELKADARTQTIPVVMVSADATPAQIQRLRGLGAEAYLTKPLEIPAFLRTVDGALAAQGGG